MTQPVASYRLQLREGLDFARAAALCPRIAEMGVSHLYLSPILAAAPGSTHGYDVIDPTAIEPSLGGREGFAALAAAARAAGLAVILDIVPNHTAFRLDNPWLRDVLRHGEASRYARHFDIDWAAGRLLLPFLPAPFEQLLDEGEVAVAQGGDGPVLRAGEVAVPLCGPVPEAAPEAAGAEALRELHARQPWRLSHWELERDAITHRRFFNVTGLIGMRVEDEAVFDDTHALVLDLVREGWVQALRVDHVDGLARPGEYLDRLARAAGVPVWVEKILMGGERLRPWPVEGTTGYEAGAAIARVLTDGEGLGRLDALWRRETGEERAWPPVLAEAKAQVIRQDLAAEIQALKRLGLRAAQAGGIEAGEESLREAVLALLVEMPRYRTYLEEGDAEDRALLAEAADRAAGGLVSDTMLRFVEGLVRDVPTPEAEAVRVRFQQVTGALMAKAQEDTAFFRFTRCLAHCEVGAEPGEPCWEPEAFGAWAAALSGRDILLTSSHDTKRAEDARARLLAVTHLPELFASVWEASKAVEGAEAVGATLRWYVVQSLLAVWEEGRRDVEDRLALHVEKAMREAREVTTWSHPREPAEEAAERFARALARSWAGTLPAGAAEIMARGDEIALAQVALKMMLPGLPDLYQGADGPLHHLTDPDNREAVDWDREPPAPGGFAARKRALTLALLAARRRWPGVFAGPAGVERRPEGGWRLWREGPEGRLDLALAPGGLTGSVWPEAEGPGHLALDWRPAAAPAARAAE